MSMVKARLCLKLPAEGRLSPRKMQRSYCWRIWVRELHSLGEISRAIDPTLDNYHSSEAELVLTLGLLCCHPHPDYRPTMRRVL
ncbi:hypothetical protein REPUB_Repub01dG0159000 [Reevesia pubescens]